MENLTKHIKTIGSIILFIIAAVTFYYQVVYKPKTIIGVERSNEILLTKPLDIEGVSSKYTYTDYENMQTVEFDNLWRTTFTIRNIGDVSIYGDGFPEPTIIDSKIPLTIDKCDNVLSTKVVKSSNKAFVINSKLTVSQWHPDEFVEIEIISSGESAPNLIISDRSIKDSNIIYSEYSPEATTRNGKLINKIPVKFQNALWWTAVVVMIFIVLSSIGGFTKGYINLENNKVSKVLFAIIGVIAVLAFATPLLWIF